MAEDDEDGLVKLLDKARRAVTKAEKSVDTAKDARRSAQGVLDRADVGLAEAEKELADAIGERDALDLRKAAAFVKRTGDAVGPSDKPVDSSSTNTLGRPPVGYGIASSSWRVTTA